MSYSQYRQYDGSLHGKVPTRSSVISGIKSLAASEDGEHHTQEGSFTASSSSKHPYNRQPFSSAKRKSKMGRMPTAPLPTRKPNFKFAEEEENVETSEETTTEKENSSQHTPSSQQLSSLSSRHIARKQFPGQPFQQASKNHSMPFKPLRSASTSKESIDRPMAIAHSNQSVGPKIQSAISHQEKEKSVPIIQPYTTSEIPKLGLNGVIMSTFETQNKDVVQIDGNNYRKIGKIGRGGSSVVYKALDENNQIRAIKKVNLSEIDQKQAEDFKNEIHYLDKLRGNDRIIELIGWEQKTDQDGEALYVVMEYGEKDLGKLLNEICGKTMKNMASSQSGSRAGERQELTDNKIKFYWEEMLEAVQVIHQVGIVHRDLKPANFVIVGGRLKLIDFGIASSVADDKTHVTMNNPMGTFNYMSPEACQGVFSDSGVAVVKLNYKADVWSLGCILYNMVYKTMPFGHLRHPIAKINAILDTEHNISFNEDGLKGHDPLVNKVLKLCLVREPSIRASIEDLLVHPYLKSKGSTNTPIRGKAIDDLLETCTDLTPNSFKKAILKGMRGLDAQK